MVPDSRGNAAGGAATTGTGRVGNVDVLRALAAFAVLAGHAYALGGRPVPVKAQHWFDVPLIATATGVWLFFGISGYVISRPFVDRLVTGRPLPALVPYAVRRALRIFPLYWICLTAVIVIDGAAGTQAWQFPIHYALLQNLVPGRQLALLSVAWTLTIEVIFYAVLPVLALALRRWGRTPSAERVAALVLVSWGASVAFTVCGDLAGDGQTGLWLRGSFPAMWQMFCPGILLAVVPHLRAPEWRRWLVNPLSGRAAQVAMVAILAVAAVLYAAAPLRYGVVVYQLAADATRPLFAIGFGLLLAAAIRARPVRARWILHLGLVSYGIYLLHAVLLDFLYFDPVGRDLVPLPHGGLPAYVVHLAYLAIPTIVLAMASWRWLERPLIDLGRRFGDRWSRRHSAAGAVSPSPQVAASERRR
jgi:peptidoglycan/LPS O-acetylase OafA/YrhL